MIILEGHESHNHIRKAWNMIIMEGHESQNHNESQGHNRRT